MEPYCKVGGLGDVIGALPERIVKKGPDVKVIIPFYGAIDENQYDIDYDTGGLSLQIGDQKYKAEINRIKKDNFDIILIGNKELFDREGIYADGSGKLYKDNFLRFLFFQKAALAYLEKNDISPDILHCHDNQSALVPVFLKYHYGDNQLFKNTKTILTLHNIGYQGITEFHNKKLLDLPEELFYPCQLLEWYGQINPLKAGILSADKLTTVSKGHAREITEDERLSAGLMDVIKSRKDEVVGIVNGINENNWSPENDQYIYENYSLASFAGKKQNKINLLKELDFPTENLKIPLIGIISRLVEQKGIELIIKRMKDILAYNTRMVILGTGAEQYQLQLEQMAQKFPERLSVNLTYNVPFSHRIIAGSDILLMPSRYEPCGITQMMAMEYGTIPLAHRTGGLEDTITPGKTGFLFDEYNGDSMIASLDEALKTYKEPSKWEDLMINGMNTDFSWDRSVDEYFSLYSKLTEENEY